MDQPYLGILIESPNQFYVPLFQYLVKEKGFRLKVFYMSRKGIEPFYHRKLKLTLKWDIPMLDGYNYEFLRNYSPIPNSQQFFSYINLGVIDKIAKEKFDAFLIHGYAYASCWIALLACRLNKLPVFLRGESEDFFTRPKWKKCVRNKLLEVFLKRTTAALYIGTYNYNFYLNHNLSKNRLFYVPYCVDNIRFNSQTEKQLSFRKKLREELGLNNDTIVFVLASKHRADRYPLDAIRAYCLIPKELNTALLVLGDGPIRVKLESFAKENSNGRRIYFTGMVSHLVHPAYLGSCDVMIHPSSETWGGAVSEGIAAGLAVISSDQVLGWPDMVHTGENGFVYPCHNIEALAKYITLLAEQPVRVKEMRLASRRVSEQNDFKVCADSIAEAINRFRRP